MPFILTIIGTEYLLRKIPNSHMFKADDFDPKIKSTKILILGNSHAANALNPQYLHKNAYNLSQGAQSLDIDCALLKKYADQMDSLEYIIVPISYHSLWLKLSDLEYYKWMAKYNNIYFDINIETNPLKRLILMDRPIKNNLMLIKSYYWDKQPVTFNFINGFMAAPPTSDIEKTSKHGKSIAKGFTVADLNFRYQENIKYLSDMINIAKNKQSKVIFITIPCYSTYIDNLDKKQMDKMLHTMDSIKDNKNVFYFNLLNDALKFTIDDFNNGDHLSYKGAQKVSCKIDSIIRAIENPNIDN